MRIDILTLFPDTMRAMLGESILGRAQARGLLDIRCHQIRDYTENRQKQVDDYPVWRRLGSGHDGAAAQELPRRGACRFQCTRSRAAA